MFGYSYTSSNPGWITEVLVLVNIHEENKGSSPSSCRSLQQIGQCFNLEKRQEKWPQKSYFVDMFKNKHSKV